MPSTQKGQARLRADVTPDAWRAAAAEAREHPCLPDADDKAVEGLKFSDALPRHLAAATVSERLADIDGARIVLDERHRFEG